MQMNNKLSIEAQNDFEKDFFKIMYNPVFGKTTENVTKYKHTKLVTTERRRNYLVSEPNYIAQKVSPKTEMKKTQITMNKIYLRINFVYLGLSILDLSKTAMQEFWFDYMKPKYGE